MRWAWFSALSRAPTFCRTLPSVAAPGDVRARSPGGRNRRHKSVRPAGGRAPRRTPPIPCTAGATARPGCTREVAPSGHGPHKHHLQILLNLRRMLGDGDVDEVVSHSDVLVEGLNFTVIVVVPDPRWRRPEVQQHVVGRVILPHLLFGEVFPPLQQSRRRTSGPAVATPDHKQLPIPPFAPTARPAGTGRGVRDVVRRVGALQSAEPSVHERSRTDHHPPTGSSSDRHTFVRGMSCADSVCSPPPDAARRGVRAAEAPAPYEVLHEDEEVVVASRGPHARPLAPPRRGPRPGRGALIVYEQAAWTLRCTRPGPHRTGAAPLSLTASRFWPWRH